MSILLSYLLCALAGAMLAWFEIGRGLGRWMEWNRAVGWLVLINIFTACAVYTLLVYALGVDNGWLQALYTGLAFPVILRSDFTLYQPISGSSDGAQPQALKLPLGEWYQQKQKELKEEADAQAAVIRMDLIRCLQKRHDKPSLERQVREILDAHLNQERVQHGQEDLQKALTRPTTADQKRKLIVLLLDLLPMSHIKDMRSKCKS
jgi:hypothetical protein